jgi:hypothetical protein
MPLENHDVAIKAQFVTSLMQYYKIEEDINLRAHIADVTMDIHRHQYREFFRRLSAGNMSFMNPFEKISSVAKSFRPDTLTEDKSAKHLYDLMYELRKSIILSENTEGSAQERFEKIHISKIKDKNSGEYLLNAEDIEVIRNLGKRWIFDNVAGDKSYFLQIVNAEYEKVRLHVTPQLAKTKES